MEFLEISAKEIKYKPDSVAVKLQKSPQPFRLLKTIDAPPASGTLSVFDSFFRNI
jgi:hypothetical protein